MVSNLVAIIFKTCRVVMSFVENFLSNLSLMSVSSFN